MNNKIKENKEKLKKVFYKDYSDKAIKVEVVLVPKPLSDFDEEKVVSYFAPKSMLKDGCLPTWFVEKKIKEVEKYWRQRLRTKEFMVV
jgi:hypothetical protein